MSGICAVWHKEHAEPVAATLTRVLAGLSLSSNGRAWQETAANGVAIGAHGSTGEQSVFRNDRVMLACDVDLLNTSELQGELGPGLERSTPAALLAMLYERFGEKFVHKLQGGFAVILWDFAERRILAALDGFGIKRLAWYENGRVLAIASRVDALRTAIRNPTINPRAIANVLNFSSNLGPETIFVGVNRLMPGTLLKAVDRETRTDSYWDMRYGLANGSGEEHLSRELESVVERSVAAHCGPPSVPGPGAFLSGGTDSSTVVGLMTRVGGAPVKAFSIGFEEEGFSELGYAEIAAQKFGAQHITYLVNARDCLNALAQIVRAFDEPFGNSSAIATYFCARLAADHGVRTLLAGDGGDELFGGNERYATERIFEPYQSVPKWLRAGLIEPLARVPLDAALLRRARGYIRRANMGGVERMLSFQFLRTHAVTDVFDPDFLHSLDGYSILDIPSRHYDSASASSHLDRLLYVDMKITLADNDLPKVMVMSELAGIRSRFPFLDRSVAEFSGRIPPRLKVKGFQKRYLFKRAFRNVLPPEIIRKKKHGFGIPVAVWMRTDPAMRELAHDILLSNRTVARGYFRQPFIEELFRRHQSGSDTYYGDTLWTLLMLELWHRHVVDEPLRVVA